MLNNNPEFVTLKALESSPGVLMRIYSWQFFPWVERIIEDWVQSEECFYFSQLRMKYSLVLSIAFWSSLSSGGPAPLFTWGAVDIPGWIKEQPRFVLYICVIYRLFFKIALMRSKRGIVIVIVNPSTIWTLYALSSAPQHYSYRTLQVLVIRISEAG